MTNQQNQFILRPSVCVIGLDDPINQFTRNVERYGCKVVHLNGDARTNWPEADAYIVVICSVSHQANWQATDHAKLRGKKLFRASNGFAGIREDFVRWRKETLSPLTRVGTYALVRLTVGLLAGEIGGAVVRGEAIAFLNEIFPDPTGKTDWSIIWSSDSHTGIKAGYYTKLNTEGHHNNKLRFNGYAEGRSRTMVEKNLGFTLPKEWILKEKPQKAPKPQTIAASAPAQPIIEPKAPNYDAEILMNMIAGLEKRLSAYEGKAIVHMPQINPLEEARKRIGLRLNELPLERLEKLEQLMAII